MGPLPGGPCWGCLRRMADDGAGRTELGDYTLLEPGRPLGEGSSGIVHLAEHAISGELVALKVAKPGTAPELFLRQAKIEGGLRHPHIVSARLGPSHEGRPSLVMPFIDGGKLTKHAVRRGPLEKRLELVVKMARAVHAAHEVGVVHCDLKADNVLLDSRGEPHLCDFGVACGVLPAEEGIPLGGTAGWMSPEQVRIWKNRDTEQKERLTTASDVFTLGVLVHWLVTGKLPFGSGEEFYRRVNEEKPPALPRYRPDLGWGMLAVANRALKHDPAARYSSAAALADDLENLRQYRPTTFSVPFAGRAFRWAKRHPGARNAILLLLPCFAIALSLVADRQSKNLREAVLAMNGYAASGQAAAVLYRLRDISEVIARAAESPALRAIAIPPRPIARDASGRELPGDNPCRAQTGLADSAPLRPFAGGFSTMMVLDSSGCVRARVSEEPPPLDFVRRRLDWRDYFAGAKTDSELHERTIGIRKAYRSSVSGLVKFAVSAPLLAAEPGAKAPVFAGVVSGSLTVASALVLPDKRKESERNQVTVVLGPFEGDAPAAGGTREGEYTFLSHPKLKRGAKVILSSSLARELAAKFPPSAKAQFELPRGATLMREGYEDPLSGGRWLAAFAPVGGTGYVVLVQTSEDFANRPNRLLAGFAFTLGAISILLLGAWGGLLLWSQRASRASA